MLQTITNVSQHRTELNSSYLEEGNPCSLPPTPCAQLLSGDIEHADWGGGQTYTGLPDQAETSSTSTAGRAPGVWTREAWLRSLGLERHRLSKLAWLRSPLPTGSSWPAVTPWGLCSCQCPFSLTGNKKLATTTPGSQAGQHLHVFTPRTLRASTTTSEVTPPTGCL